MVIGYINSKWSMPRRLALISAIFLLPSLAQLYIYADHKLGQIRVVDKEVLGAKLGRAIWNDMSSDQSAAPAASGNELAKLASSTGRDLGIESEINAFATEKQVAEKASAGQQLLGDLADASQLTTDSSMDTYHAQEIFTKLLPQVKLALSRLQETLSTPTSEDAPLVMAYAGLNTASENLRKPLSDLLASDPSGEARRMLGSAGDQLQAQLHSIASKIKAANYQRVSLAAEMPDSIANASKATVAMANETAGLFISLAEKRSSDESSALYRTLALLIAATIAAVVMVALLSKGITTRLSNLVRAMDLISRKDLNADVPYLSDSNENGAIAQALARFKEAVIENKAMTDAAVEAAKQQQEQGDHYAKEHERFMDAFTSAADRISRGDFSHRIVEKVIQEYDPIVSQMNLMMEQLEQAQIAKMEAEKQINVVVESLGAALSELAEGDLETGLYIEVAPQFAKLKADFNSAASTLKSTIALVKKNAGSIKLGTDEISQASDDLSRRTENQAASLEETAAAVKEITDTVNKTARGATHARETVSVAKGDAEKSGEIVRKAIEAMTGIENSSKQISQIIGVIDEIAFQTNLLALNAGVEAARAGDAGRGFAVVASEVRALAQRSAEAAKEIKGLISASTGQVAQGVQLVGETGLALTRIVTQVGEINSIVTEIAASANEQAHGLEQVNTAVNEMDQVTQQNAAMVEEATAATQALAQQTEELAQLVSRFKTGDDTVVEIASRRETAKPAARAVRPAAKLKMAANGSSRPSSVGADAGWEEF
ncbi:methyl-accepting chemotaxis protein [Hyphomicrobium sp.]|uniref:methyl-accepting chemotaxis protein n=1 Tax=Hyphomicrobium sp. TaxID=82 RepID=UPI002D150B91|nr:methyl-accepting chemotaxis protein [Hyphomicrobium sp.]HVZ04407.1 methyl-accepting chemotaxis protein [Hyphomicrobium sp.]